MGRKPIKATQAKYQKYIDVIMDDLGLTGKVFIEWRFSVYTSMGGDAKLFSTVGKDGFRAGRVRITHDATHDWTIKAIMHELRHIWQFYNSRLSVQTIWKTEHTKRGKVNMVPYKLWDEVEYKHAKLHKGNATPEYLALPWEIDAREYELKAAKLFPNNKVIERKLVGVVGKVKFYKIHA